MTEALKNTTEGQPKRRVFIASQSKIKADAVRAALSDVEVIPVESASRISEQPMGYEETLRGARNRVNSGREHGANEDTVAIENGVVRGEELMSLGIEEYLVSKDARGTIIPTRWYDLAFVLVTDENGREALALSDAIEVPQKYLELAQTIPDHSKTWSKFMVEDLGPTGADINHQDPHAYLTGVSRVELMKAAIREADRAFQALKLNGL